MSGNPPPQEARRGRPNETRSRSPFRPVFSPPWGRSIPAPPDAKNLLFQREHPPRTQV